MVKDTERKRDGERDGGREREKDKERIEARERLFDLMGASHTSALR